MRLTNPSMNSNPDGFLSRKQILSFFITALLLGIMGCAKGVEQYTSQKEVSSPVGSLAPLSSVSDGITPPIILPTYTPTDSIQAFTPGATQASPGKAHLQYKCLDILPTTPIHAELPGQLVMIPDNPTENAYLLDLSSVKKRPFPSNPQKAIPPLNLSISPDHRWVSYFGAATSSSTGYSLVIRSYDGKSVFQYSPKDETSQLAYWLDNDWLVLVKHVKGEITRPVIVNIFTGDENEMLPNFPMQLENDYSWYTWPSTMIYNADLSKLIYIKDSGRYSLVLWSQQTNQALLEIPNYHFHITPPKWSNSGNELVYIEGPEISPDKAQDELVLVTASGGREQLTQLASSVTPVDLTSYSWSPDDHFLAFWMNKELSIIDLKSKSITNYCIASNTPAPGHPSWSPDGRYLAVGIIDQTGRSKSIIVDLKNEISMVIAEDVVPVGWLVSEEE